MEITFSFSTDSVLKEVYALSAMRTYLNSPERILPMLTPDNAKALRMLAGDVFAEIIAMTVASVVRCELPSETINNDVDNDLMTVVYRVSSSSRIEDARVLRRAFETVMVFRILSTVMIDDDSSLANQYSNRADMALANLKALLQSRFSPEARIFPFY